jgi:uncharacterized membrane protein YvlD (DUF360 family)
VSWVVSALALWLVAQIIPGIQVRGFGAALIATLVIAVVNATFGVVLKFLFFPITFLTLGVFLLVINALLLKLASLFTPGFAVRGFLSAVLGTFLPGEGTQAAVLKRFGYLLGRYIYLCDALDDLDDDRKTGNYNPFLCSQNSKDAADAADTAEHAKGSLYLTVAEAGAAYDLLETGQFGGILDNIVFLGLKNEVERILKKKGEGGNGRSL